MTQSKASATPPGYRWVVFCLLAFGYLLVYFPDQRSFAGFFGRRLFLSLCLDAASFRPAFRFLGPT